jgi:hypothetical protein
MTQARNALSHTLECFHFHTQLSASMSYAFYFAFASSIILSVSPLYTKEFFQSLRESCSAKPADAFAKPTIRAWLLGAAT